MARNYKLEYKNFHSKPKEKKRRAQRNQARGLVSRGDGKDVDHRDRNTSNNSPKNLRVASVKSNRSRNSRKLA